MQKLTIAVGCSFSAFLLAGCPPSTGTSGFQTWFTGLSHSTVWGSFGVINQSAPPPQSACSSNTPPRIDPPDFWSSQPTAKTNIADAMGTTIWSSTDLSCPRVLQTLWRSAMVADLSSFYTKVGTTTQAGNHVAKATLEFNVIPMTPANPLSFPCDPYMGSAGVVSVLQRNPVVNQAGTMTPIDPTIHSGLLHAQPATGPFDQPHVIAAFPVAGDVAADLSKVAAAGTFANGSLTVADTGPGIHDVRIDVTKWVTSAANLNMQSMAFSVAGINEITINPATAVQFDCRDWVEPVQLNVQFF